MSGVFRRTTWAEEQRQAIGNSHQGRVTTLPPRHAAGPLTRRALRVALTLTVVVVLWGVWRSTAASAHVVITSSQPSAGERLGAAPGRVVLGFSEPLNTKLSSATVLDPTGRRFDGGASGDAQMVVTVATNALGVYEVRWTAVSVVDGHTVHGSFEFGVGVGPTSMSGGTIRSSPTAVDLAISLARAVEYAALLLAVGMLLLAHLARDRSGLEWVRPRLRAPLAVALLSGIAVVLAESLAAAGGASVSAEWTYLTTGPPGLARLARLVLETLALAAAIWDVPWLWACIVATVVALAAAGHAATIRPAWWGIGVDAVHILAAGVWVGGILALATLRPPGGWRSASARSLVSRFSPVAVAAFALTAAAGAAQAFLELGGIHALVGTSYGWALVAKMGLVAAMVPLSVRAWRRRAVLRSEAVVAILVVGATAVLAAYPLPPGRYQAAEAARRRADSLVARPRPGDLTLGAHAGEALVGLTLRPGLPGENRVIVFVLPLAGEGAAASSDVGLSVDGRVADLSACGATCRQTTLVIRGGETFALHVGGPDGGNASFAIPSLPATDGSRLLDLAQRRMHRLSSYRIDESFLVGNAAIKSRYVYLAPNRMKGESANTSREVWIGQTVYTRSLPGGRWKTNGTPDPLVVPFFMWDYFHPVVAPRIVGTQRVDGRVAKILSFAIGGPGDPIWFRLWVDRSGLVRRSEMRAPGHYVDHRFFGFDAPATVEAPSSVAS